MKRKVRLHKPCYSCGGKTMQDGGGMEAIEAQSTAGKCSGSNFGGPNCPKGSPQYNLAVSFRKMMEADKKKIGGSVADQNKNIDEVGDDRRSNFSGFISTNATNAVMEQQMLDDYNRMRSPIMQTGGQDMGAFGYNPDNANIDPYIQAYQENQGKLAEATENLYGVALGTAQLYGDNKNNTTTSIKTEFLPEYRKEGRQWQRDQKRGFKQQDKNAMANQFSNIRKGMSLEELQYAYGGVPFPEVFPQGAEYPVMINGGVPFYEAFPQAAPYPVMENGGIPVMQGGQSVLSQYGEAAGDWFNNLLGRNDPAADAYLANLRANRTSGQTAQDDITPIRGGMGAGATGSLTNQPVEENCTPNNPCTPEEQEAENLRIQVENKKSAADKAGDVLSNKPKAKTKAATTTTTTDGNPAKTTTTDSEGTTEEEVRKGNADPQTTVDADGNEIFVPHQTLAVNPTGRFGRRGIRDGRFTNAGFGAVAYDPRNTYINDFKYKSGLFGPKVKMSFTHAGIPPWEAEKIQQDAANGDVNAQQVVDQVASSASGTIADNSVAPSAVEEEGRRGLGLRKRFIERRDRRNEPASPQLPPMTQEEIDAFNPDIESLQYMAGGYIPVMQVGGNMQYVDPREVQDIPVAQSNRQLITEPNQNVDFMKSTLVEKRQPFGGRGAMAMGVGAKVGADFLTNWKRQGEQAALARDIQRRTTADNVFTQNERPDFGQNTVNTTGVVDPYGVKASPQFTGMARYGGSQYQEGGEYDLTESEIEQFLRAGGKIEYID